MTGIGKNPAGAEEMKQLAQQLEVSVNGLIAQSSSQSVPAIQAVSAGGVIRPVATVQNLATAGFIKLSSLQIILFSTIGAFVVTLLANYILHNIDLYNTSLVIFLIQLAAILLAAVLAYSNLRAYHKRQEMRRAADLLLRQQRELEAGRNQIIRGSLEELKGPLAQLKTKLQAAVPANPNYAKPALNGVLQLESLLQKFTILTSLESAEMGKQVQSIDLNQLVNQSVEQFRLALSNKGLHVNNKLQGLQVTEDPLLVTFVIDSLLSNAIKYSPQGGEITIDAHQHGHTVQLQIHDNGPGIAEVKQAELFQPFSRAENAAQDFSQQGVGLSLFLDKLVMHYLNGEIGVESLPGAGTTMGIELPVLLQ